MEVTVYRYTFPGVRQFNYIKIGYVNSYFHSNCQVELVWEINRNILVLVPTIADKWGIVVGQMPLKDVIVGLDKLKNSRKSFYYDALSGQVKKYIQEKQTEYLVYVKHMNAARLIQRKWRDAIANPYHDICKKRLMREFNDMGDLLVLTTSPSLLLANSLD